LSRIQAGETGFLGQHCIRKTLPLAMGWRIAQY
jgi:hypothetical protein